MKSILILKAAKDICGDEIKLITHHCQLLGITVHSESIHSEESLEETVKQYAESKIKLDYIYLCTHGNKEGFIADLGEDSLFIKWSRFSQLICESEILNDETILLLGCCKGGLFQIAADILAVCNSINFVCGVTWNVLPWDLTTGFVVFIHNIENKQAQPSYAAEKASLATDYKFVCYDRDEIEASPQFENRKFRLFVEIGWLDKNGDWIIQDEKIKENAGVVQI